MKKYSLTEISRHNTESDCWVVVHGAVIDVTKFLQSHPGGVSALSKEGRAGCDVSSHFDRIGHSEKAKSLLKGLQIGIVDESCHLELDIESDDPQNQATEDTTLLTNDTVRVISDEEREHAIQWHAMRRRAILQDHPEVANLMGSNPLTVFIGVATAIVHCMTCMYAQLDSTPWYYSIFLAYTVGAVCKMYQFAINHDICHGTAGCLLERFAVLKGLAMQVCTLPTMGGPMHTYYEFQHIGHHSSLGTQGIIDVFKSNKSSNPKDSTEMFMKNLRGFVFFPDGDGDLFAIGTLSLGYIRGFNTSEHNRDIGHVTFHFMFEMIYVYGLIIVPPVAIPMFVFPERLRDLCIYIFNRFDTDSNSIHRKHPEEIKQLMTTSFKLAGSVGLHSWLSLLLNIWLLFYANNTWSFLSIFKGWMYLYLSELFLYGFAMHPFMGYFLGTHRSGGSGFESGNKDRTIPNTLQNISDEYKRSLTTVVNNFDCQPTMSTYCCWASLASMNLTLHVEHHDFPNIPWSSLPAVRRIAPEYYDYLEQSPGFMTTIYRWIHHSGTWSYACQ